MKIQLNGKEREFTEETLTISDLLALLKLPPGPVAAQVNEEIVHRDAYATHPINDGDIVEIFTMLGGG
ncbi:MAG: sulfur carrier protein ThiS [Nitrospinae bacterium]|nr:sulfur carrier protein ThiS [Nitrospinota bacterium]